MLTFAVTSDWLEAHGGPSLEMSVRTGLSVEVDEDIARKVLDMFELALDTELEDRCGIEQWMGDHGYALRMISVGPDAPVEKVVHEVVKLAKMEFIAERMFRHEVFWLNEEHRYIAEDLTERIFDFAEKEATHDGC